MELQEMIIHLIHQDLRHNRLVLGIERMGFSGSETHFLDISKVVFELMENGAETVTDEQLDTYNGFMERALEVEESKLNSLAQDCYKELLTTF